MEIQTNELRTDLYKNNNSITYDSYRANSRNDKENLKRKLKDLKSNFDCLINDVQNDVCLINKKGIIGIENINDTVMSCIENKVSIVDDLKNMYESKIVSLNDEIKKLYEINKEIKFELREVYIENREIKVKLDENAHNNYVLIKENKKLRKELKELLGKNEINNKFDKLDVDNFELKNYLKQNILRNENIDKYLERKCEFSDYDNQQEKQIENINANNSNNKGYYSNKEIIIKSMNKNFKSETVNEQQSELEIEIKYLREKNKEILEIAKDLEKENIHLNDIIKKQYKKIFFLENKFNMNENSL